MTRIKTKVIEGFDGGHQVQFSIDHQSFKLQVIEDEKDWPSLEHAKWYEKQLKIAFDRLLAKK